MCLSFFFITSYIYFSFEFRALEDQNTDVPQDLDATKMVQFENPTRGLCHLCTVSGKMLSANEIKQNIAESVNVPISELVSIQKSTVEKTISENLTPGYQESLKTLGINLK